MASMTAVESADSRRSRSTKSLASPEPGASHTCGARARRSRPRASRPSVRRPAAPAQVGQPGGAQQRTARLMLPHTSGARGRRRCDCKGPAPGPGASRASSAGMQTHVWSGADVQARRPAAAAARQAAGTRASRTTSCAALAGARSQACMAGQPASAVPSGERVRRLEYGTASARIHDATRRIYGAAHRIHDAQHGHQLRREERPLARALLAGVKRGCVLPSRSRRPRRRSRRGARPRRRHVLLHGRPQRCDAACSPRPPIWGSCVEPHALPPALPAGERATACALAAAAGRKRGRSRGRT